MTRRIAMVVAAAGLALVVAGGGSSLIGPGAIRITDKLVKHTRVDAAEPGHAGDLDFYRQSLFNRGVSQSPIGHSDLTCLNTGTGSSNCSGTYFLPKGKLMVTGVIASRLFYELAVVGGTGLYDNVRGTLTATYLGGSPPGEFLLFRLVE
jgi:hypothetical protein